LFRLGGHQFQSNCCNATAPEVWRDVQLVNEPTLAAQFQAMHEGQHDISDPVSTEFDYPGSPKRFLRQEVFHCPNASKHCFWRLLEQWVIAPQTTHEVTQLPKILWSSFSQEDV
jgi:hypothetical protein